jgi:2-C-methyl-D-erythritol 2,4-cyclodiphosphate synthase
MNYRTGFGYDVHRLERGKHLILGSIHIPFSKGLVGHSDADVLLHSICDAMLGAISDGDLGQHFPDTDPGTQNISSLHLLESVQKKVTAKGYRIVHLDATLVAEDPRLAPHLPQMRSAIAKSLGVDEEAVNIKAKTNEKLGYIGRGEGIAAQTVCTVMKVG